MPILGVIASSTRQGQSTDAGAMYPLQVITVGSAGTSSITFSNIPATYKHLQIRLIARTSYVGENSTGLSVRFNGDSGSNYVWHRLYGDGANVASNGAATASYARIDRMPATSVNSLIFGAAVVDILDYANTNKNKTMKSIGGWDSSGLGWSAINGGLWRNANTAITSITIADADGTAIPANSKFALYGIKGA